MKTATLKRPKFPNKFHYLFTQQTNRKDRFFFFFFFTGQVLSCLNTP